MVPYALQVHRLTVWAACRNHKVSAVVEVKLSEFVVGDMTLAFLVVEFVATQTHNTF